MSLIGIAGFVVAFGLAVFVHELGHFLAAKAFGVPVERFVIGFDREAIPGLPGCIWERRIGETVYGISLVPLGGYVKMSGVVHPDIEAYLDGDGAKKAPEAVPTSAMRPDGGPQPVPDSKTLQGQAVGDMAALYKKPFYQKVIIYGAGVVMNLILAMCVMTFQFARGFEESAPFPAAVAWISPTNTFSEFEELNPGDRIAAVAGTEVETNREFLDALIIALNLGKIDEGAPVVEQLAMRFERESDGTSYVLAVPRDRILDENDQLRTDFYEAFSRQPAHIDLVIPNDPADKAGIRRGDTIMKIDGSEIEDWAHFRYVVSNAPGKPLEVLVDRKTGEFTTKVTPVDNPRNPGFGLVGVVPGNPDKERIQESLLVAAGNAPQRTWNITTRYVTNLQRLFGDLFVRHNVSSVRRELGGPVGIAQMAYRQAQEGLSTWLRFLIILNVALAVMNILPFPVLDGGHICFAAYEAIFKKPVSPRILVPLLNGAVIFILVFFLLVTANDLLKIFA